MLQIQNIESIYRVSLVVSELDTKIKILLKNSEIISNNLKQSDIDKALSAKGILFNKINKEERKHIIKCVHAMLAFKHVNIKKIFDYFEIEIPNNIAIIGKVDPDASGEDIHNYIIKLWNGEGTNLNKLPNNNDRYFWMIAFVLYFISFRVLKRL